MKKMQSYRIDEKVIEVIQSISSQSDLSQSEVIEMAVMQMAIHSPTIKEFKAEYYKQIWMAHKGYGK